MKISFCNKQNYLQIGHIFSTKNFYINKISLLLKKMSQENFDEDMISENIATLQIPIIITARQRYSFSKEISKQNSISNTFRQKKQIIQPQLQIQEILYGKNFNKENIKKDNPVNHKELVKNLYKYKQNIDNKIKIKKKEHEEKELNGCTFRPQINQNTFRKRTIDQFVQDQLKFSKKVIENKNKLKHTLDQDQYNFTFKPKTNKSIVINNSMKESVHQRLYNLRNQQNNSNSDIRLSAQYKFTPNITEKAKNLQREEPVQNHLYQDALRRQSNKKCRQQNRLQNSTGNQHKSVNLLNQRYVAQRFIKQYYNVLEQMELQSQESEVNYQKFKLLLQRLNFLPLNEEQNNSFYRSSEEIYEYLHKFSATTRNVCVMLMALLGIYHINPVNGQQNKQETKQFNIDQVQGRRIQKRYDHLFRNRLYSQELKKPKNEISYSFKPLINQNSEALAQTYRNKILEQTSLLIQQNQINVNLPKDGYINHYDLLHLNKITKEIETRRKREVLQEESVRQCTFQPKIGDKRFMNQTQNLSQFNIASKRKNEQLYELSKNFKKENKTTHQIEFEKNMKQCTFAPKINKNFNSNILKSVNQKAKDFDKSILRMVQGRKERQQKHKFLSVHEDSHNHSIQSNSEHEVSTSSLVNKNHRQEQSPFLVIDVNLGDQVEQIIVYRDQTQHAEKLVQEFSRKHNLDIDSRCKLLELLKIEINSILQRIEEEDSNISQN